VRPAARSARTRPRRTCSIFLLRWGTSGPLTDGRAAPGPTRAGGVWLVQIPPASRSPRLRGDLTILKEAAVGLCRGCRKPHPVAHRPLLDPWRLARACCGRPPSLPRSFPARDWTTGCALRQRSRPSGTRWAGQGAQDRCAGGWLGTRHSTVQRSRAHRPDQLGWRPILPAGTGDAARRGRPDICCLCPDFRFDDSKEPICGFIALLNPLPANRFGNMLPERSKHFVPSHFLPPTGVTHRWNFEHWIYFAKTRRHA